MGMLKYMTVEVKYGYGQTCKQITALTELSVRAIFNLL